MEKITILTEPSGRSLIGQARYLYSNLMKRRVKSGPAAVVRSLVSGFDQLGVDYNFNPMVTKEIGKVVVVLSNFKALEQAIDLKRTKIIDKIIAGPNIAMLPNQITSLKDSVLIDVYIHPSISVVKWWNSLDPKFCVNQKVWYAGVDAGYLSAYEDQKRQILIYKKKCPEVLFRGVVKHVSELKLSYGVIKYGRYSMSEYKSLLSKSTLMVYLSESESQGIALFEAWSCNVPTLVWNKGYSFWKKYRFSSSTAPYLSETTGAFFKNISEFKIELEEMQERIYKFHPREWILLNGTDMIAARKMLEIIDNIK